ncbi:MAG: cytochrome-c peroxidase [Desulfatirhabdiaceae bacterium]
MRRQIILALATAVFLITTGLAGGAQNTDQIVQLGGAIYKDTNLSINANQSCMTCHHPSSGYADPANRVDPILLPVSEGSILGLFGGRNAPSAGYAGFSPILDYDPIEGLWIGGMFWDGRATGWTTPKEDPLAEQALGPFLNPVEMALDKATVIRIIEASDYATLFIKVFGPDAFSNVDKAYAYVGEAIAAYERSKNLNKFNSKFDKFWAEQGMDVETFGVDVDGYYDYDPADFKSSHLTQQEAYGLALFNAVNKGNCAACHLTKNYTDTTTGTEYAPLFTDFSYDNLGIPANPQITVLAGPQPIDYGLGKTLVDLEIIDGIELPKDIYSSDTIYIAENEAGKFKVPTLRNVARSAPYGHNGFFATLLDITHFYNTRDIVDWPDPEVDLNLNNEELGDLKLTPDEEAAIVAFMNTLTD